MGRANNIFLKAELLCYPPERYFKKTYFLAKSLSHLFRTDGRGRDSEVMELEGNKVLYKLSQCVGCCRSAIFVITDMHLLYRELKKKSPVAT